MHFDLTISLGNILTVLAVLGAVLRVERQLAKFLVEHEILIGWYCKEHNITAEEIPTRARGVFQ